MRSLSLGSLALLREIKTVTPSAINRPSSLWAISKVISRSSGSELGSRTIILFASAGPLIARLALSRRRVGAPPETVFNNLIKDIIVAGPQTPSTFTPTDFWNSLTAPSVRGPKTASTRPQSKPISISRD